RHGKVPGLRFTFRRDTGNECSRILVSVPKKLFKRAVKRNLLKRRIRESWRKQKHLLNNGNGIDLLITYSVKEIMSYDDIFLAVTKVIEKINERTAE
ncbi:MAG: ribonuclease P protein component, partial [Bacteroidales bacterium]|nr:ribonuclease P protein component [Bacteroidales bacterium]